MRSRSTVKYSALAGVFVLASLGVTAVALGMPQHDTASAADARPNATGSGAGALRASGSASSAAAAGTAGSRSPAGGAASADVPGTTSDVARPVTYLGHTFTVPAGWRLVDLAHDPTACVRFDTPAVYLGSPSSAQRCTVQGGAGVQDAVLVEPSSAATGKAATDDAVGQRIEATLPGVQITASYDVAGRSAVVSLLSAAGVPAPAADAQASTRARAELSALQDSVTSATVASMTGRYTGLGFDACTAPSTDQMTDWSGGASPFAAIGVYIGGAGRACAQPELTASWVTAEAAAGWHLLPLYVGPQASSGTITNAAAQGTSSADDAAAQAAALGIGAGAVLYYDMEGGGYTAAQTATAQTFLAAWTTELHALGYRSAVYGNETGALGAMTAAWGTVAEPDVIDVENWNGQADDDPGADPSAHWASHRVHQFQGPANATYGGFTDNIDEDYFNLGIPCSATPSLPPSSAARPNYQINCTVGQMPGVSASASP